jgi:type I restriction enzyme S subunit
LRPYLNKVVLPDEFGVGTSELIPLLPDPARLHREFLAYYLRSAEFLAFAASNTRGANLPRISMDALWSHLLPLPPTVDEQQRIVTRINECMERVDEIQSLRKQSMVEAQAVLPAVLHEVFESLNGHTRTLSIGEVTEETRYGTSRKCHGEREGTAILRIPNVADGKVNFDELKYCNVPQDELDNIRLRSGDLLFVRTNGSRDLVGRSAIFEAKSTNDVFGFASYLIRVRLDTSIIHPQFLAYFLNSTAGRQEINKRRRTSAGQFNINSENLRTIPVPIPSLSDQESLLCTLADRESRAVQLVIETRDALEEDTFLRASILRKAFNGEL